MVLKHFMMTVALLALVAGVAVANCGSCPSDATDTAVAADTGCGGAARGASVQAVQDGYTYTYALNNGSLEKRKGCGMVVKAVKVDCPMLGAQAGMQGCGATVAAPGGCGAQAATTGGCGARAAAGACGACAAKTDGTKCGHCAAKAAAAPAAGGCAARAAAGGCGGGGCGDGPGNGPKLAADADGVYLKCQGKMFAWDLDLNPKAAPAGGCSMGAGTGGCGGGSCSGGAGWEKGPSENRGLQGGIASLKVRPMRLSAGTARIQFVVYDTALAPDGDATVTAFVYPTGQPEAGSGVEMVGVDTGEFRAAPELAEAGVWELAVRVTRPGVADEVVYYMLDVK